MKKFYLRSTSTSQRQNKTAPSSIINQAGNLQIFSKSIQYCGAIRKIPRSLWESEYSVVRQDTWWDETSSLIICIPRSRNFFGEPGKDSITALAFLKREDKCMGANNWMNTVAYNNFYLALHSSVLDTRVGMSGKMCRAPKLRKKRPWLTFLLSSLMIRALVAGNSLYHYVEVPSTPEI